MRRRRPRAFAVAAIAAATLAAIVSGLACLPDLVEPPAAPTPVGVRPIACGDGFLDTAAGEECDPGDTGDGGVPGCTRDCKAVCEGVVVPSSAGSKTGHCYFALSAPMVFDDATRACAARGAHLVTVGSGSELRSPAQAFGASGVDGGSLDRTYWIGLTQLSADTGLQRYLAVAPEPGFAPPARCPGCYGNAGVMASPTATFPKLVATDSDVDATCVVARVPFVFGDPWYRVPCTAPRDVVCEREPVGARSYACNGGICVTIALTALTKRYLYVPAPSGPREAERACAQLTEGRLVVYDSPTEREELFRELSLARVLDANSAFWIGLSFGDAKADGDAGTDAASSADAAVWSWGNGSSLPADGLPWAEAEPKTTMPVRAFSRASGTYDTELAHADTAAALYPYVCQYGLGP